MRDKDFFWSALISGATLGLAGIALVNSYRHKAALHRRIGWVEKSLNERLQRTLLEVRLVDQRLADVRRWRDQVTREQVAGQWNARTSVRDNTDNNIIGTRQERVA